MYTTVATVRLLILSTRCRSSSSFSMIRPCSAINGLMDRIHLSSPKEMQLASDSTVTSSTAGTSTYSRRRLIPARTTQVGLRIAPRSLCSLTKNAMTASYQHLSTSQRVESLPHSLAATPSPMVQSASHQEPALELHQHLVPAALPTTSTSLRSRNGSILDVARTT